MENQKDRIRIFHTVNAGLYLTDSQTGLLVDGLHKGAFFGMSCMPEELKDQAKKQEGIFRGLNGLLFTHLHDDHYDQRKVIRFLSQSPNTALWGPGLDACGLTEYTETTSGCQFRVGDFRICAYKTRHSGNEFLDVAHTSLLLRSGINEETIFVAGDALFVSEEADEILADAGHIDKAFVNLYHLIEQSSIEFLLRLKPGRVLLYHRPLPEDDVYHYGQMIRQALRKDPLPGYVIEQPEHMSWIL